ncbi:hypothetical protein ACWEN3_45830, partial [Streptomyces sp. NPDC004561]
VADLGSTNGTTLDAARVGDRAVRFPAGALLRIGESALRVTPSGGPGARLKTVGDGEGCVRVPAGGGESSEAGAAGASGAGESPDAGAYSDAGGAGASSGAAGTAPGHAYDSVGWGAAGGGAGAQEHRRREGPTVTGQGWAPSMESRGTGPASGGDTHAGRFGAGGPGEGARRRGIGAWARRLAGGRGEQPEVPETFGGTAAPASAAPTAGAPQRPDTWPDPAALLLTALGPGPRLWERGPGHPEALTVRLGTADRSAPNGSGLLPAVPVTAALREAGALGLAGPRPRLSGLARAVVAQLAALDSPDLLEIVLISADRSRPVEERAAEWSWLGWLPHVRPGHGQDCRLLLAFDREQAAARAEELLRRVEDHAATGRTAAHPASARPPAPTPNGTPAHGTPTGTARIPTQPPAPTAPGPYGQAGPGPHTPDQGRPAPIPPAPGTPFAGPRQDPPSGALDAPAFGAPAGAPGIHPAAQATAPAAHLAAGARQAPAGTAPGAAPVRRPSWARDDAEPDGTGGFAGPYTIVVVDGDPGGAALREAVARLAVAGPRAGIHVVCLAETEPASPASPVARTYEAACAVTPTFRQCGAVALLSGDVASALQLMRVAPSGPVGAGTVAAVDAVSPASTSFDRNIAESTGYVPDALMAAPLLHGDRILGVLEVLDPSPQARSGLPELD